MKAILKYLGVVDRVCEVAGKITMWLFIPLFVLMAYEVIMRYVFISPTLWSYDMTYLLNSIPVVFGMSWVYKIGGHVRVDIVYNRFSPRNQAIMDLVVIPILFLVPWVFVLYRMSFHVLNSIALRELAMTGTWIPPIYPFKTWLFVGFTLLFLQVLAEYIRALIGLVNKQGGDMNVG